VSLGKKILCSLLLIVKVLLGFLFMHHYGWSSSAETCSTVREVLINLIHVMIYVRTSYENVVTLFLMCRVIKTLSRKCVTGGYTG